MSEAIVETKLPLPGVRRGKVRDVYPCRTKRGEAATLLVATDRISAFDVVMPTPIPDKGRVLTQTAAFWFKLVGERLSGVPHHLLSIDAAAVEGLGDAEIEAMRGRVMVGRRCDVVPIECVVRGYLAGSGWKEYQRTGRVCGVKLPEGLRESDKLPEPIFTPATKAESGHDENISFDEACERVGEGLMRTLRERSMEVYRMGHEHAASRGIVLADTKFEFGLPVDGKGERMDGEEPTLIDEVLTPDSSRFWPADDYAPGRPQQSFDKQYVRDYLEEQVKAGRWSKQPPGPTLPKEVVAATRERYLQAYRRLTGNDLDIT
ncbi:MAG: phosphoribosylaminoimidazolesuccinocarboxamide synthase [Phycisphaeraceae bacterium]